MERRSACLFIAVSDHQSSGVWGPRISGTGCLAGLRPGEENVNDFCGLWAHQQHLCDGKGPLYIGVPGPCLDGQIQNFGSENLAI